MFSGLQFLGEWLHVAFWSAGLMFFLGLFAWALANFLDQPSTRWICIGVGMVALVCWHGWGVWFQSEPTTWAQHMEYRDSFSPTHEQAIRLVWTAFWGGIAGLAVAGLVERWLSGRTSL